MAIEVLNTYDFNEATDFEGLMPKAIDALGGVGTSEEVVEWMGDKALGSDSLEVVDVMTVAGAEVSGAVDENDSWWVNNGTPANGKSESAGEESGSDNDDTANGGNDNAGEETGDDNADTNIPVVNGEDD